MLTKTLAIARLCLGYVVFVNAASSISRGSVVNSGISATTCISIVRTTSTVTSTISLDVGPVATFTTTVTYAGTTTTILPPADFTPIRSQIVDNGYTPSKRDLIDDVLHWFGISGPPFLHKPGASWSTEHTRSPSTYSGRAMKTTSQSSIISKSSAPSLSKSLERTVSSVTLNRSSSQSTLRSTSLTTSTPKALSSSVQSKAYSSGPYTQSTTKAPPLSPISKVSSFSTSKSASASKPSSTLSRCIASTTTVIHTEFSTTIGTIIPTSATTLTSTTKVAVATYYAACAEDNQLSRVEGFDINPDSFPRGYDGRINLLNPYDCCAAAIEEGYGLTAFYHQGVIPACQLFYNTAVDGQCSFNGTRANLYVYPNAPLYTISNTDCGTWIYSGVAGVPDRLPPKASQGG